MAIGLIVLDTYTIYYEGRYATFKAKSLYSSATERQTVVKKEPYFTVRKFIKPDAYVLKTTNKWFYVEVYHPPSTDRNIRFITFDRKSSNRYSTFKVETKVRYCYYEAYDENPPKIIGQPKFLNWNEIPRTFYFKADLYSPYPIVPETVLVSLERLDKNQILNYSLEITPDKLKVYKDDKRKNVYIIECHFGIVFDPGENLRVGIDAQNEYGASINGSL